MVIGARATIAACEQHYLDLLDESDDDSDGSGGGGGGGGMRMDMNRATALRNGQSPRLSL